MGKKLIIKGANFSVNALEREDSVNLLPFGEEGVGLIDGTSNQFKGTSNYRYVLVDVSTYHGKRIYLKAGTGTTYVAFLSSSTLVVNQTPSYANGWSATQQCSEDSENEFIVPNDATVFYYFKGTASSDRTPDILRVYLV